MEVRPRRSRLVVSIPPTLPDIVTLSDFDIMYSIVTALKPPHIESCLYYRPRILILVKVKFQPSWCHSIRLEHPPIDEWMGDSPLGHYFERRDVEWPAGILVAGHA